MQIVGCSRSSNCDEATNCILMAILIKWFVCLSLPDLLRSTFVLVWPHQFLLRQSVAAIKQKMEHCAKLLIRERLGHIIYVAKVFHMLILKIVLGCLLAKPIAVCRSLLSVPNSTSSPGMISFFFWVTSISNFFPPLMKPSHSFFLAGVGSWGPTAYCFRDSHIEPCKTHLADSGQFVVVFL